MTDAGDPRPAPALPVSVIVLTFDEERNIERCLQSLAGWAGEIYVVDSGSSDRTTEIAGRYTEHVVDHPFENYSRQRNWAQDELPLLHPWVLHVDADETVSPELAASIRTFLLSPRAEQLNGAMVCRRTIFMGRWIRHGGHYPVFHLRLFRRALGRCEDRLYDQHYIVSGPVTRLEGDLIDVFTEDLDLWTRKHLRWAEAEARELSRTRTADGGQVRARLRGSPIERRRWLRGVLFARSPLFLRAFLYFLYRYVIRRGFLDGVEGLIFHFLHGCWFRFYLDARIWEAARQDEEGTRQTQYTTSNSGG